MLASLKSAAGELGAVPGGEDRSQPEALQAYLAVEREQVLCGGIEILKGARVAIDGPDPGRQHPQGVFRELKVVRTLLMHAGGFQGPAHDIRVDVLRGQLPD